mgnify:CR=1 FL=1|jgi:hypothetical protein|tara:strand:+ start:157 stop:402 length:246 start_codon:yes stop_codon:yes gene_type:complete
MANYAYTTLGITETASVDAVNDSKFGQVQATSFTVNASNLLVSIVNASASDLGINQNTIPGFLTGRRPHIGQLFPRGVYNK